MMFRVARTGWVVWGLGTILVATLHGQIRGREERPSRRSGRRQAALSLLAGPSAYDFGTTGTGFSAGLRVDLPWVGKFLIEPGIGFLRYTTPSTARLNYLFPEVSFQFSPSNGAARPYAGAGLGLAEFASGPSGGRGTVHVVAGLRLIVAGRFGIRAEGRYRIYDPFGSKGTMLDLEAGGSWALGNP